jgi:hypothetical protein
MLVCMYLLQGKNNEMKRENNTDSVYQEQKLTIEVLLALTTACFQSSYNISVLSTLTIQ